MSEPVEQTPGGGGRAARILVVEDQPDIQEMVTTMLETSSYEVTTAWDGAEALRLIDVVRPMLVLLDLRMPTMSGLEFLRAYRLRPEPRTPIVVFTAATELVDEALAEGAAAVLAKPFGMSDLNAIIERHAQHPR